MRICHIGYTHKDYMGIRPSKRAREEGRGRDIEKGRGRGGYKGDIPQSYPPTLSFHPMPPHFPCYIRSRII